jgi:benzoyl-CoA reductase/2-hydroxyglutaryl-CoA dehydratase subunit BcrC/BadD/HgdB
MSEIHGLRIEEFMQAKKQGRKVIGTFCLYVPEENIIAADAISVGLCAGADFGTDLVELKGAKTRERILDRIAERYLGIDCAVFTPNRERIDHIIDMPQKCKADGVVHHEIQFCTPHAIESHSVKQAMNTGRIPFLRIETDYSMQDVPQIQTRVQEFLELLKQC